MGRGGFIAVRFGTRSAAAIRVMQGAGRRVRDGWRGMGKRAAWIHDVAGRCVSFFRVRQGAVMRG